MHYILKSGLLSAENSQAAPVRIKSTPIGSRKKIYSNAEELLLETSIRCLDETKAHTGDVRNREYLLTDSDGKPVASAYPAYAPDHDPDVVGWPISGMPRVDHAKITVLGEMYILTMHNSQNYTLCDLSRREVLRIMHRGLAGGWSLEDHCGFAPEILCGIFAFCRYIEQENEFLIA